MKLKALFFAEYAYRTAVDLVDGETEGDRHSQLYGGGDGRVSGERLSGIVEWENAPYFRADGIFTPNVRGLIKTDDGARVRFEGQGYSLPEPEWRRPDRRYFTKWLRFYSRSEAYQWLNTVVALEEGVIEMDTGRCFANAWQAEHDYDGPPESLRPPRLDRNWPPEL